MFEKEYDAIVIGGGAAGLAAAELINAKGYRTAVLEREEHLGGILLQCIHNGFGLHKFKKELTGPEYAEEYCERVEGSSCDVYLRTTAMNIENKDGVKIITACSSEHGVMSLKSRAVVLAMGCRERNRGNVGIPGTRPSGIFTAGLAQRLINMDGYVPGKEVVIVGSGDIGLIMARRLSWTGAKVKAVVEIMPHPSGLTRNIVQCLDDFNIPLYLSHGVTRINGRDRVESVDVAPLVDGTPDLDKSFNLECDTVLLSIGLIPENELSRTCDVELSKDTNGPFVNADMQTNVDGVFACGNVLHVHDLVDFVSEEAEKCGKSVISYLRKDEKLKKVQLKATAGANLKYITPSSFRPDEDNHFFMRSMVVMDKAKLLVKCGESVVAERKLLHVKPAEMISLNLKKEELAGITADETASLEVSIV